MLTAVPALYHPTAPECHSFMPPGPVPQRPSAEAGVLLLGEKQWASSTQVTCRGHRALTLVCSFIQMCLLKHVCGAPS